jgi:hypothetical protein
VDTYGDGDGLWRLGISTSVSDDLARLGLVETHFRVAIGEITRAVLLGGGGVVYGGRLDPAGYTNFMLRELQRYARRDRPLLACLSAALHRGVDVAEFRQELGLFGHLVVLDADGRVVDDGELADRTQVDENERVRGLRALRRYMAAHQVGRVFLGGRRQGFSGPIPGLVEELVGLRALRRYMAAHQVGRVFLGGRRQGFSGPIPGLVEELVLTLERRQPVYLAGGFGGTTYDSARALGVPGLPDWPIGPGDDPRLAAGIEALVAAPHDLHNGLSEAENAELATTHRPAQIAALVSRGLRRVLGDRWSTDLPSL